MTWYFICPSLRTGGAEMHWVNLVPSLAMRGESVEVICIDSKGELADRISDSGIGVDVCGRTFVGIFRLVKKMRHDAKAVVTRGVAAHFLGFLATFATRASWVVNWHRSPRLRETARQRFVLRAISWRACRVIAVDPSQIPIIRDVGFKCPIDVIPNGTPAFDSNRQNATTAVSSDGAVFVMVASLRPEKRADLFIRALAAVDEKQLSCTVSGKIVGEGPMRGNWEKLATQLCAPVVFVGHSSDVDSELYGCSALVNCSDAEAAPLTMLEAMAIGIPIVATNVGGVAEIIDQGKCGILTTPGSTTEIADAMELLVRKPSLARQMGLAGRERHAKMYSLSAMAFRYEESLRRSHVSEY